MVIRPWFTSEKTTNISMTFHGEKPLYKGKKVLRIIFFMEPAPSGNKFFRDNARLDLEDGICLITEEQYDKWARESRGERQDYVLDWAPDATHAPMGDWQ